MVLRVRHFCRFAIALACCGGLLASCGKGGAPVTKSQIITHIGNDTVTTQELENEFRSANVSVERQQDPAIIKRVLGELVTRKYLVQQAIAAKLDREPGVLLDTLRARELVLQNAYVTRAAASKAPGSKEVDRFISENPAKFANRKVFNVDQIVFPLGPSSQSMVEANRETKSLENVDQQLTVAGIPHSRQTGALNSSDLPQDFLASIEAEKEQNVFFVQTGPNGMFFKVKGEESSPISGEAAANLARQLIKANAMKSEVEIAAYSANIEAKYDGQYAKIMRPN